MISTHKCSAQQNPSHFFTLSDVAGFLKWPPSVRVQSYDAAKVKGPYPLPFLSPFLTRGSIFGTGESGFKVHVLTNENLHLKQEILLINETRENRV